MSFSSIIKNINKKACSMTILILAFGAKVHADVMVPDSMGLPEFGKSKDIGGIIEIKKQNPHGFLTKTIAEGILYVGILAIIAMIIGGLMYMTSIGNDTKIKKAKNIVMYAIIGVLISILAYSIVDMINNFTLTD